MSDKELVDYCVAHCRTDVGEIHKDMMKRLIDLAGESSEGVDRKEWWRPSPEWVDRLANSANSALR